MGPPEQPVAADLIRFGAGLRDFALYRTLRRLAPEPNAEGLTELLRNFGTLVGPSEEPSAPCPRCVGKQIPTALVSELVPLQRLVQGLDEAQRRDLRNRVNRYLSEVERTRDGDFPEVSATCPFLDGVGCLAGSARPLSCRGGERPAGFSEVPARAFQLGHQVGLRVLGLDHHRVELGATLTQLLDDPGWVDSYFKGDPVFREQGVFEPSRDPAIEMAKAFLGKPEPSGFPAKDEVAERSLEIAKIHGAKSAIDTLFGTSAAQQLARLQLPLAYRTEDEIDEWRGHFSSMVDTISSTVLDPIEAFDALRRHMTFAIPYHGRSDRAILKHHGARLIAPIVARALPDLVEPLDSRPAGGRIRVGYVGANLRDHNAGAWALGWIANHERDIESFVVLTRPLKDSLSPRFRQAAGHYYVLPGDVPSTARFIKSLNLDILIYTDIGLDGSTYQFAGMRLAPIQCTAWGHPVTSGLPTIDYFLSSEMMEPDGAQDGYSERLVKLPGSGQFLYKRAPTRSEKRRSDFGLPEGFLALVPQALPKMVPRMDPLFARISQALTNPPVFFDSPEPACNDLTKERFEKAGIRAHWLPRMTPYEYRRVVELSDVLIDPPVFNGGMTTLEALGYGKPVVTLPGEFMRGRFGLTFLTQANMGSLIARDEDEFVRLAADRHAQAEAVSGANFDGPFADVKATHGLNDWIRRVARG